MGTRTRLSVRVGDHFDLGNGLLSASGEGFRTDGYVAVPANVRGSVDTPVASEYGSGTLRLERLFGEHGRAFLAGSIYGEDRQNGTPLQVNDTTIRQLAFGTDWNSPAAGLFTLRMYGGTQNYHQTFSSIAGNRNSESLTNIQYVPVQQMGMLAQWSKQLASRFTLLAGLDGLDVQGFSNETSYSGARRRRSLPTEAPNSHWVLSWKAFSRSRVSGRSLSLEEKTCGATWTPARVESR